MKNVYKGVIYNILCLSVFTIIYLIFINELTTDSSVKTNVKPSIVDIFYLSVGIQSGTGISNTYPLTDTAKIIMMAQELCSIFTTLFIVYLFTL